MANSEREAIAGYVEKIWREWRSGQATEHTYRPMLKELMESLLPRVLVINEPKHIACGAPDYLIRRGTDILGFIEAKDIGDGDLDGRDAHKEQFDRYKDSLDTLCFTDYLDFRFYDHFAFVDSVRIAEVKGNRLALADDATLDRFVQLVLRFAEARPQHIASPSRLAQLMAGKARLLAQAIRRYLGDAENADSMLAQQMEAFRNVLIHDIDADSFADIFAQTVTYGMFAARLHDKTPEDFSRAEAATLIPKTNPLLRQMFQYIAMDTDDSIEWIIDDLVSLFAAVDVEKLMRSYGRDTQKADPLLHFYEDFLAAYDPRLRKARGVWYTPKPVVDFIVRSVDSILARDFALPGGLADPSKTKVKVVNDAKVKKSDKSFVEREVHRVQILDPAAGTGTFLAETVKLIHAKVAQAMGEGAWQGYVADNLLPRLNGFEILMASYAMAHLKLDMLFLELGGHAGRVTLPDADDGRAARPAPPQRLRVFLTNSLEPYDKEIGTLFAAALSREANEANFIKRDCPVMVVMGNPPYSVSSANKGEWIQGKIADYKKGLNEKKLNLDDDYIKFLRLGQYHVDKNGEGVLAFISNNSFLDGITHRQMRKSLLESFDEIYVLNLHGNARKKETAPDGSKDENVFDIMQGVSINIFVKRGKTTDYTDYTDCANSKIREIRGSKKPLATVRYADLYGVREAKYAFLDANTLESVKWQTLAMQEPYYFFVPKDFGLQEEYEKGFKIDELMPVCNMGIVTDRDALFVDADRSAVKSRCETLLSGDFDEKFKSEYRVFDSSGYPITKRIKDRKFNDEFLKRFLYRPFDLQWVYYDPAVISRPCYDIMKNMLQENVSLLCVRNTRRGNPFNFFVSDTVLDKTAVSSFDNCRFFPLYLYSDNMGKVEKVPNFDAAIFAKICAAVANPVNPVNPVEKSAAEIREFLCGEPVARLTGHEFEGVKGGREIVCAIYDSYARVNWAVAHPLIGEVRLTKSGINDSLRHGFGRFKLAAFEKIPEIIRSGVVVLHSPNWKERGYESFVVAAPIAIGGEAHCAFVVINSVKEGGHRFYLHEVGRLADIKRSGGLRSGSSDCSALSSTPGSIKSLAYSIFAVNGGAKESEEFRVESEESRGVEPEDVFYYIYGVLHTPSYREKYREFLKIDFPRIPYPKNGAEFRHVAAVGEKLVKVHLLKDEAVTNPFANPFAKFAGAGDGMVKKVVFDGGRVYINGGQWFEPVPEEAWNFYIGGYQPAQKWLKDRKGRTLASEELQHYRAIIAALMKTGKLMSALTLQPFNVQPFNLST